LSRCANIYSKSSFCPPGYKVRLCAGKTVLLVLCIALTFTFLVTACAHGESQKATSEESAITLQLTSPAFAEGVVIPAQYTCDGENISPPLKWSNVPRSTKSLALIVEDPDAPIGTFTHWVIYDIPPTITELAERVPTTETIPNGARQGLNDMKRVGYGGPCPPSGSHRYLFKLYALDATLDLKPGETKQVLTSAMSGHILAAGQLMGTYERK
jgi:Raf kinase inhibitor-like YbhB/YbcL family protein